MLIVESLLKVRTLQGVKHKYYYRLLCEQITDISLTSESMECYGIEVERQDYNGNTIVNIERNSIEKISPYRHKVHNLLKLLYDNSVSPIHLIDVLGEYVDEYIQDFDEVLKPELEKRVIDII